LTLEGATADLLKYMDQCYIVDPANQIRLRDSVMCLYKLWRQSPDELQAARPISQYDRNNLTGDLAQVLEQLV
jgi:hypothetical protein